MAPTNLKGEYRTRGLDFVFLTWKLGLRWFLRGVNYWRFVEYPAAVNNSKLTPSTDHRILDIGSAPFSLLPLYLALKTNCTIHALDVQDYVCEHRKTLARVKTDTPVDSAKFVMHQADARHLPFRDNSFDRVASVSTVQNIPGDGDIEVMQQIARVLKKNGIAFISVPFSEEYCEEFYSPDTIPKPYGINTPLRDLISARKKTKGPPPKKIFYQRLYDSHQLFERIINPSTLQLVQLEVFGTRHLNFGRYWDARPPLLKAMTSWMAPLLTLLFIRKIPNNRKFRGAAVALITLKKIA